MVKKPSSMPATAMQVQKMSCAWGRLYLLLSLLLQLPGSQAKCYFQAKALCRYEGKQFSLAESWLSTNCLLCTCLHPIGVGCCEITQHPIDFPDWCEAHYDSQTCQISVVRKANPSLPCVKSMEHKWGSASNKVLGTGLSRQRLVSAPCSLASASLLQSTPPACSRPAPSHRDITAATFEGNHYPHTMLLS
ncbi:prostate-associated microseminoprotein-like [Balearica regulorum gibbericeps]|uniref:prostate-associated microseminoprotein-like n=1 Tax=Balearica regulorum gibbericeps TaxID=100784 RepID=UPI003F602E55